MRHSKHLVWLLGIGLMCLNFPASATGEVDETVIRRVYERLVNAIGHASMAAPELRIVDKKVNVASYFPGDRNIIELELPAYAVCQSLGADSINALAFLLAHELGHHYKSHGFLKEAASAYANTEIGQKLHQEKIALDTTIRCETEADEFACYYMKMAGFGLGSAEQFMRAVYTDYQIPDSIARYPSLDARCNIARTAEHEMERLNNVFNLANVLLLEQEYEYSISLFKYILNNNFGSREIKNNLGICYSMLALQLSDEPWARVIFPFTLDPLSRASSRTRSISTSDSPKAQELYKIAESYFNEAASLDPEYYAARINAAMVKALMGKFDHAINRISELEDEYADNSDILEEISYARSLLIYLGKKDDRELETLARKGHPSARESLSRLRDPYAVSSYTCKFPASPQALELQSAIKKAAFTSSQIQQLRSSRLYIRDSLGLNLILLNFTQPQTKIIQLIRGKTELLGFTPEQTEALHKTPDHTVKLGAGSLERRCAEDHKMTYYTLRRDSKEEWTIVVF